MLSASAFLRVALLVVTAAVLAALVQHYWPNLAAEPATETRIVPRVERRAPERRPDPAPPPPAAETPLPVPAPSPAPAPAQAPSVAPASPNSSSPSSPSPSAPVPSLSDLPAPPVPARQDGQASVAAAEGSAGPRALALVDLNSASLGELNRLQGGGNIGRSIIQRRPYAAVGELVSKRVLSRAVYERIKDQVTVR